MDENRIMDKLDRIAEDGAATRAEVKNLYAYVQAVSGNQKKTAEDLQSHEGDSSAHGLGAVQKRDHSWAEFGALAIALGSLALTLWKH